MAEMAFTNHSEIIAEEKKLAETLKNSLIFPIIVILKFMREFFCMCFLQKVRTASEAQKQMEIMLIVNKAKYEN